MGAIKKLMIANGKNKSKKGRSDSPNDLLPTVALLYYTYKDMTDKKLDE
jgi:hypothetical protein